ncbi:Putative elongator complex protein 1 [Malassezia sp. CBS 17886]|nr:Putative elongator complex protein 1 [Malassezia sp. CBS 17886]
MRNLVTLSKRVVGSHRDAWDAVAVDADSIYSASAPRGAQGLVGLTLAQLQPPRADPVLATLGVVAAPFPCASELADVHALSDGGAAADNMPSLCAVTRGGDIVLLPPGGRADIVGSVDSGIRAAAWSFDEDLLVLVTGPEGPGAQLLVMTRDFDILRTQALATDAFGEDHPVNVGWGSKETQFHGSAGKAAALAPQAADGGSRGPPVPEDDGGASISWRRDSAYFTVSSLEADATGARHRIVRMYTRTGELSATSDAFVRGFSHALACKPTGNLIASTQRTGRGANGEVWATGPDGRHDVVFFERNGLRHGEFTLRGDGDVRALAWNADGSILAVHRAAPSGDAVQLWTMGNYHWYLKQTVLLPAPLSQVYWHPERPHTLLLAGHGGVELHELALDTARSLRVPPHDAACVAVVDGSTLMLTPFRLQNVPPPMCAAEVHLGAGVRHVAWAANGRAEDTDMAAVLLDDSSVQLCALDYGSLSQTHRPCARPPLTPRVWRTLPRGGGNGAAWQVAAAVTQSHVSVLLLRDGAAGGHELVLWEADVAGEWHAALTAALPDQRRRRIAAVRAAHGSGVASLPFAVHDDSGAVALVGAHEGRLVQEPCPRLETFCATVDVFAGDCTQPPIALGLAADGRLVTAAHALARDCSSFTYTDRMVTWTTHEHQAKFLPLDVLWAAEAPLPHSAPLSRRVERGSRIVTAVPSAMSLVLQMPRGNLETIAPRPMVLDVVRHCLDQHEYGAALRICRSHRVDLNLLHDHAPGQFLRDAERVVAQTDNEDHINLLLTSLRDEDVTETLYPPLEARRTPAADPAGKVNRICDAFLAALSRSDERRFLRAILTAHVRKVPADYEGGLRVLLQHKDTDARLADEACRYIIFLVNAEQLYRVALGMYDFSLALLIAQHAQMDPREYVPFLRSLRAKEPAAYQRFCIDDHLGRHAKALHSLARAGDAHNAEAAAYMVRHRLYREGLSVWAREPARLRTAYVHFTEYLLANQRAAEAATAFQLAHEPARALAAFQEADMWEEAMTEALALRTPLSERVALARAMAEQLETRGQYVSAAHVLLEYAHDVEQGVALLCRAHAFAEAKRVAGTNARWDLVETHVHPAARDAQGAMRDEIRDMDEQLAKQQLRLASLADRREVDPAAFFDDDAMAPALENIDMQSDTHSQLTQFTRYTSVPHAPSAAASLSTLSLGTKHTARSRAKQQKKEEKKRNAGRKGTVYEEDYLYASVQRLLQERLRTVQCDAARLLPVLVLMGAGALQHARALQGELLAFERAAASAAEELATRAAAQERRAQEMEMELVAHVAQLAHQGGGDPDAPGATLAALWRWREATKAPARVRVVVASEKWKLHLLDEPGSAGGG